MMDAKAKKIAVWALTPGAALLGHKLVQGLEAAELLVSTAAGQKMKARWFRRLAPAVAENFRRFSGHIFIMATGIVVRQIAGLLRHKTEDPAVVVMDETGRWAISLVSGHLGGANELAILASRITGARPVITTASDCLGKPAIDSLAAARALAIANPEAIKAVNMALIKGRKPLLYDPAGWLGQTDDAFEIAQVPPDHVADRPVVVVSEHRRAVGPSHLLLHPPSLALGLGCRRDTSFHDLSRAVFQVLEQRQIAAESIFRVATAEIKRHEKSIARLANELGAELIFYTAAELKSVEELVTHSALVEKHIGVKSVCEAAAILAAGNGPLVVTKQKTKLVTVALARRDST